MQSFERILVRAPNWLGDWVLAQFFFETLRERFPNAHITVACPRDFAPLVEHTMQSRGGGDEVVSLSPAERTLIKGVPRWWQFRRSRIDCFISLPSSWSAAWLGWITGARVRVGFAELGAECLLTHGVRWPGRAAGVHKAQLYARLVDHIPGGGGPVVTPTVVQSTQALPPRPSRSVVLAPGASIKLREWPYFVELTQRLLEAYPDWTFSVVGTSGQSHWVPVFAQAFGADFERGEHPRVRNLIGQTDTQALVQVCEQARLVVANDSGAAHVAATLAGVPTVVLYGPGDPHYIQPVGRWVWPARLTGLKCSPCESPRCRAPYGYKRCLEDLKVDPVLAIISQAVKHSQSAFS